MRIKHEMDKKWREMDLNDIFIEALEMADSCSCELEVFHSELLNIIRLNPSFLDSIKDDYKESIIIGYGYKIDKSDYDILNLIKTSKTLEVITGMEDDTHYSFTLVNLELLSDKEKEQLIFDVAFSIDKDAVDDAGNPCWKLCDGQGANYGNINNDCFKAGDYDSMIDRLDIYWRDYGYIFSSGFKESELEKFKLVEG